jgi:hypothetical protein
MLISREVTIKESDLTGRDQGDFNIKASLHLLEELFESLRAVNLNLIVNSEAFWDGLNLAHKDGVIFLGLGLVGRGRL